MFHLVIVLYILTPHERLKAAPPKIKMSGLSNAKPRVRHLVMACEAIHNLAEIAIYKSAMLSLKL